MSLVVVYNPKSGSSLMKNELQKVFTTAKLSVDSYISLDNSIEHKLKPYCKKGSTIAVVGGDGTIGSVASIMHASGAVMAPLPGGTLNHFTKDAGIAQDLPTAIKNLQRGKKQKVDVVLVNGRLFLNNSSIGMYPTTLMTRRRFEDRLGKWPVAVISSIRALIKFRLYTVAVNSKSYTTPFIFIGNNEYDIDNGGTRETMNKAKLCVYIIKSDKRRLLLKLALSSFIGKARINPELIALSPRKLTIHSRKKKLHISTDGELVTLTTPLTYESLPGALTILS